LNRTLILGIGNTLLGDEGAGVHALEHIARRLGPDADVDLVDGGTLSFTLLPMLESYERLIVLDSAQLGGPAGTVQCFESTTMDEFLGRPRRSVHEVGLCDLMNMARLSGCFPAKRALIGIQPEFIDWSENCSAAVGAALPVAADHVVALLERWDENTETVAA
jgi:hydrogenase maturation protease